MTTETYIQLSEFVGCMTTFTARIFNMKNNAEEASVCAKGLAEMADKLPLLGKETFNPTIWQQFCIEVYQHTRPIDIDVSELQTELWQRFTEKLNLIKANADLLEENSANPEMISQITVYKLKPILNQCKQILDSERPEIRGKTFWESIKERFKK